MRLVENKFKFSCSAPNPLSRYREKRTGGEKRECLERSILENVHGSEFCTYAVLLLDAIPKISALRVQLHGRPILNAVGFMVHEVLRYLVQTQKFAKTSKV